MELTIEQALQQGVAAHKEGNLQEAERVYRAILQAQPKHPDANHNLGNTLQELGRLEEAEESYRQAIALKSDFAEAHNNLGVTLADLGRLDDAVTSHKKAIALKSDYAEAHFNLGFTLKELGKLEEAEESYRQAIALKLDFAEVHFNLGNTLQELGRLEEAEASFRQAIALKSDFAEVYFNLGVTLVDLGRLDDAVTSHKKAIALKSDYAEAHNNLGTTLKELGRLEEAEESYRQAIALKSDFAEAHDNLGVTLQALGKLEDAEVCYKKYMSLEPGKIPVVVSRGATLFNQGEFERALSVFDSYNTRESRARALESLYALGRIGDIYQRIEAQAELDDDNLRVAAIASFIAERQKKDTAHKFCRNPLDFLHFSNLSSHTEDSNSFITEVIEELCNIRSTWQPPAQSVRKGFQTRGDLFKNPKENLLALKSIILNEIESYYARFKNETCLFIKKWPVEKNISAWHVVLKEQGYNVLHHHQTGWLSGVIYLKVVPSLGKDEGAIQFDLAGASYYDANAPKITYNPQIGDMVFFPSSLHHRTIPFTTDTSRIIVSFDLNPKAANH